MRHANPCVPGRIVLLGGNPAEQITCERSFRSEQTVEGCGKLRFLGHADEPLDFASPFEQDHRRNSGDPVFGRSSWIVIGIHFADANTPRKTVGQFFNRRGEHLARTTPGSPEVDQHRVLAAKYFRRKIGVREFHHLPGHVVSPSIQTANPRSLMTLSAIQGGAQIVCQIIGIRRIVSIRTRRSEEQDSAKDSNLSGLAITVTSKYPIE